MSTRTIHQPLYTATYSWPFLGELATRFVLDIKRSFEL
jgi:hypothetical protein